MVQRCCAWLETDIRHLSFVQDTRVTRQTADQPAPETKLRGLCFMGCTIITYKVRGAVHIRAHVPAHHLGTSRSNTCASTSTRSTTLGSPGNRQSRVRKASSCAGIEFSCPYRGRFPSAKVVFIRPSRSRALAKPQHHGQEGLGLGVTKRPRPAPLLRTTRVGTVLTHLLRFGHDPCVV